MSTPPTPPVTAMAPTPMQPAPLPTPPPLTVVHAPRKSRRMLWIVLGAALGLCGLAVGVYFLLRKKSPPPPSSPSGKGKGDGGTAKAAMTIAYPLEPLQSRSDNGNAASASSENNAAGQERSAYMPFDGRLDTYWHSEPMKYNGAYQGQVSTTVSGTPVLGEWVQLRLPYPTQIRPTEMQLTPRQDCCWTTRSPRTFVVAGSNDEVTWTQLYTTPTPITDWTRSPKSFSFPANQTASFRYFRLIVTTVGNSTTAADQTSVNLCEWKVKGIPAPGSITESGLPILSDQVNLLQQISQSTCVTNAPTNRLSRPLSSAQLADTAYTYGLVNYNSGLDGVFTKNGCRGKFELKPRNEPVFCSSWDSELEYCAPNAEAFLITRPGGFARNEAANVCSMYNGELATLKQLRTVVQQQGMWCTGGWVADHGTQMYNPYRTGETDAAGRSCGQTTNKVAYDYLGGGIDVSTPADNRAGVHCYGKRPTRGLGDHQVISFSKTKTSMYT